MESTTTPEARMSNGYVIQKIRRGDTYEYEDSRVTHRIRATRVVLEAIGCDFTVAQEPHDEKCDRFPKNLYNISFMHRDRAICTCGAQDRNRAARPELPEWLTDAMIYDAWNLACKSIEASAAVHHRAIAARR